MCQELGWLANGQAQALEVWRASRKAEAKAPDEERMARVQEKLGASESFLVCASLYDRPAGMALVEPFRHSYGRGDVVPGLGHVSMVFVHPGLQGQGIGRRLMGRLIATSPWPRLSLWTRDNNVAARQLFARCGFVLTRDRGLTPHGERISRWQRDSMPPA